MKDFNPEGLDLPPPEEQTASRAHKTMLGRFATRLPGRWRSGADGTIEMQDTLSRVEALFEAEIAGTELQRLVDTTVPELDGYHLDWLISGSDTVVSDHRLNVIVPLWRAHNAEALASLINFFSYMHSHENDLTMSDIQEFVENARAASRTLLHSLTGA